MSLGQTASAPASTWLTAVRAISSSDSSFRISPSRTTPQWPCEVYSQRQTSVRRSSSGYLGLSSRSARWTIPSSSQAPEPSSSFASGIPKRITERTPSVASSSTSGASSATVKRLIPGSCSSGCDSGATNNGITKSSRSSRVSRTSDLSASVRRSRRRRVSGKLLTSEKYLPRVTRGDGVGSTEPSGWRRAGQGAQVPALPAPERESRGGAGFAGAGAGIARRCRLRRRRSGNGVGLTEPSRSGGAGFAGAGAGAVRLAEVVGALSLATDAGMGAPLELGLGTCVIATRLADALGCDAEETRRVYYLALLRHIGCTAGSHEFAALVGDELEFHHGLEGADFSQGQMLRHLVRTVTRDEPPLG